MKLWIIGLAGLLAAGCSSSKTSDSNGPTIVEPRSSAYIVGDAVPKWDTIPAAVKAKLTGKDVRIELDNYDKQGVVLVLTLQRAPVDANEPDAIARACVQSVVDLIMKAGRDPKAEEMHVLCWIGSHEPSPTGKTVARHFGGARYTGETDRIDWVPEPKGIL